MRKAYIAATLKTELRAKLENYRAVAQAKILSSVIRQRTEDYSDRLRSKWSKKTFKGEVMLSKTFVSTAMKSCLD